jgi:hypothetical protein
VRTLDLAGKDGVPAKVVSEQQIRPLDLLSDTVKARQGTVGT